MGRGKGSITKKLLFHTLCCQYSEHKTYFQNHVTRFWHDGKQYSFFPHRKSTQNWISSVVFKRFSLNVFLTSLLYEEPCKRKRWDDTCILFVLSFFAILCKKTPFFTGRKVKKNMRPANWFGLSFYSCSSVLWIAHYEVLSKSVWSCLRLYCHFQFLLQLQYYTECIRHLDWTSVKVMRWLFWLILIFFSEGHFMTWSFGLSPNPKRRDKSSLSKTLYRHIVKFDVLGNRNWKITLLRQVRNFQFDCDKKKTFQPRWPDLFVYWPCRLNYKFCPFWNLLRDNRKR